MLGRLQIERISFGIRTTAPRRESPSGARLTRWSENIVVSVLLILQFSETRNPKGFNVQGAWDLSLLRAYTKIITPLPRPQRTIIENHRLIIIIVLFLCILFERRLFVVTWSNSELLRAFKGAARPDGRRLFASAPCIYASTDYASALDGFAERASRDVDVQASCAEELLKTVAAIRSA